MSTLGKFHRPKPGNVVSAFDRPQLGGKSIFAQKTSTKQGGSMFTVKPQPVNQLERKQNITYSKARASR